MLLVLLLSLLVLGAYADESESISAPWGKLEAVDRSTGVFRAHIEKRPADRRLVLSTGLPPIVAAYETDGFDRSPLTIEYSDDAKERWLILPPEGAANKTSGSILLEAADKSGERSDGRLILLAKDARLEGASPKLESQPGYERIESWTDMADSVGWNFKARRPGMYDIELSYALADGSESHVEITVSGATIAARAPSTGDARSYRALTSGRIYIPKAGDQELRLRCIKKTGKTVMNLTAITLRPAPEGKPIVQADDRSVTCHARDVTIDGVQVQYEPKPEKNTVGYWTVPSDRVHWDFAVNAPGVFDVEILQGCGKGHGGSEVELSVDDHPLRFVVEDTGHFQNFIPRTIGRVQLENAGRHRIAVRPLRKPGVAVMDLRQVRLIPVK